MSDVLYAKTQELRRKLMDMELAKGALSQAMSPVQETIRQRLERKQKYLTDQLDEVTKAIEMLDKNPAFEECHDAIIRAGY